MLYLYHITREPGPAILVSDGSRSVYTYGAVDADALEQWALHYGPVPTVEVVPGVWEYATARSDLDNRYHDDDSTRVQ